MRGLLQQVDTDRLPCYLETFTWQNVAYYAALGFELLAAGKIKTPRGMPPFWALRRAARSA